MKSTTKRLMALTGILALGLGAARAQSDSALLNALVKKGVLSDQEAQEIRASDAKDYNTTPVDKLSLPDYVSQLTIYGDTRLRYEYIDQEAQNKLKYGASGGPNDTINRSRFRLRVGMDYALTDNFKGGFELETSNAADSANQTFGNQFGKSNIGIGLAFLQWKPTDWLTLVGGKQHNPIYTTDLVWDPDINPEGAAEILSFHPTDSFSIGFTAAQFDYAENQNFNIPPVASSSVWMFVEQVPVQFNFTKDMYIKEAPGFTSYMGGGIANFPANSSVTNQSATSASDTGDGSAVTFASNYATNDLQLFTAPGEFDWKVGKIPFKAYWDLSVNTQGHQRVQNVYLGANQNFAVNTAAAGAPSNAAANEAAALAVQDSNRDLTDNIAWLAGLQVGDNKKKGDWMIKGDFRQIGLGAVDPNINDSDFADSYLNQEGVRLQSAYNFTDFLTGSVTFYDTWAYKSDLMNGSAGQNPSAVPLGGATSTTSTATVAGGTTPATGNLVGIHGSQRVDIDLQWKF